jgi:DnaJ like chaperone protein
MKKYAKWIGGGMGWVLGGPIGALLGFALGSMIDTSQQVTAYGNDPGLGRRTTTNDFVVSMLVLSAAIMKADGKVMKSELDFVKRFFSRQFGERQAGEHLLLLRDLLDKPFDLASICMQIRVNMPHPMRLQMMHYLFGIALADGSLSGAELRVMEEIARHLTISQKDFESIKAMFGTDELSAYKILEVAEDASDAEIKKAYRHMATKYHPDKLGDLGPEVVKAGQEKFQKVQQAYEALKKQRGIK